MLRQRLAPALTSLVSSTSASLQSLNLRCCELVSNITTTAQRDADGIVSATLTASTSGSSPSVPSSKKSSLAFPKIFPPASIAGVQYQQPPTAFGSRPADCGEAKYTAPFWVPMEARKRLGLPSVLFVNPWKSAEDPELRRAHAKLCLDFLISSGKPLTADDIFRGVNAQNGVTFGHPSYVRMLMENLRKNRIVFGKKNPESKLGHGMKHHPRLYIPLPYQQAEIGAPAEIQKRKEAQRSKSIAHAYKRLKNSKSPYPIHRKKAEFSLLQYEQAMEAVRNMPAPTMQAA